MDTIKKFLKSFNKTDWLVVAFIFTIPLAHKELFSIYNPDLVISKFILLVIAAIGFYLFTKNFKNMWHDLFFIFLFSILMGQIFSLLVTYDVQNTLKIIVFQAAATFTYPFFRNYVKKSGFSKIFFAYFVSLFAVIVFWFYQVILERSTGDLIGGIWPVMGYPTRYGATFWDVNHYGIYLVSMLFLLVGVILSKKAVKYNSYLAILAGLTSLSLFFTGSRSSWIGLIFALVYFLFFFFNGKRTSKILSKVPFKWEILATSLVAVPAFVMYILQDQIRSAFLYRSTSFFSHLYLLKAGLDIGFKNVFTGIGANAFHAYFKQSPYAGAYYYIDKAAESYNLPLHNLWLEVLTGTGLVAFITFVILWIVLLGLLLRLYRKHNDYIALSFSAGVIAFLVAGLFYSYKLEFFWIYVILASVYATRGLEKDMVILRFKDIKEIFFYIFGTREKFISLALITLSVVSVVASVFYITAPISQAEINQFYNVKHTGVVAPIYQYFINLQRYTIGNYSFSGRLPIMLLVIATFILLFGIFSKYIGKAKSALVSAISINILMIVVSPSRVSDTWAYIFIGILCISVFIGMLDISKWIKFRVNLSNTILVVILIASSICFHAVNNKIMKDGYPQELNFIVELASNRSVLNESDIWIEDANHQKLLKYYSDNVEKDADKEFYAQPENIDTLNNLQFINFSRKNVFVVTELNKYRLEQNIVFDDVVRYGDYYILIIEPLEFEVLGLR